MLGIFFRAGKKLVADNMPMIAEALAFTTFLAIPSVLLLAVGIFTAVTGPQTIDDLIGRLHGIMPGQATQLLSQSLHQLDRRHGSSLTMIVVGAVLALWSTTSAMTTYMTALNLAFGRTDRRNFLRKRVVALTMVVIIGAAFLLVAVLLIFGPQIERHLEGVVDIGGALPWIWWAAQWPILVLGLLTAFATLLYLGPDGERPRWRLFALGPAVAVVMWLAASGLFAFYTANFGSYNKTWGSLAAVIVMLTWLWISALALLYAAELEAELQRR